MKTSTFEISTQFPDKARFIGSLHGLILGDIIGAYHEFSQPARRQYPELNALKHKTNVFGMGFSYTDDSILTLAAMDAFVKSHGQFDATQQLHHAKKYVDHKSSWSPTGRCFDVGISTHRSLLDADWPDKTLESQSGNGVLMRLLPFAWYYACSEVQEQTRTVSAEQRLNTDFFDTVTTLTHGSERTLVTSRIMGELLAKLLFGLPWKAARAFITETYPKVRLDRSRSYRGYCEDSLLLAVALMDEQVDWEEGIETILSLGGDTDSNAAIFGQLYGACYPDVVRTLYSPHKPDIFRAYDIDSMIEEFIDCVFERAWRRMSGSMPSWMEESRHESSSRAGELARASQRDRMPYALKCPRDCVHYGEGCMLGFPAEQLRFLRHHDNSSRDRIPFVRSDSNRTFWTTTLGRAIPPDAPPCYHSRSEATEQCRYSGCGYLQKTSKTTAAP